jgi:hypothetical protein
VTVEEIQARLEAATPGPWFRSPEAALRLDGTITVRARSGNQPIARIRSVDRDELWPDPDGQTKRDAEFIAHAPVDISYLLSGVEQVRRRLQEEYDTHMGSYCDGVSTALDFLDEAFRSVAR